MPKQNYLSGDRIVLKASSPADHTATLSAMIVAVMPENQGTRRLRIRLDGENFDRTVSEDDIDQTLSPSRKPDAAAHQTIKSGGWINHDLVRTRK